MTVKSALQPVRYIIALLAAMMMLNGTLLGPISNPSIVTALHRGTVLADSGHAVSKGELLFNKTFGTTDNEEANSLVQVEDGGFAVAGNAYGKGGAVDFWLVRTDANGNHLWNRSFDAGQKEYCRSVIECEDGGFALFGITRANQPTSADFWLVRTNATGGHLWNATFGTGMSDEGYEVIELHDSGFAMAGYFENATTNNLDYLLIRIDAAGNHLWNRTFGGANDDYCYSLLETNDNGLALVGTFGSTGNDDALVIRTDSDGNYLWNFTLGGALNDHAYDIIEASGGGFAVTGSTESFAVTDADMWLIRIDADGNRLWNKTYDGGIGGDEGRGLTEMSDDGFAIMGAAAADGGGTALWLVRTEDNGVSLWNKTYGVVGDSAESIVTIRDGGMAFAGTTANVDMVAGGDDMWLLLVPELNWVEVPADRTIGFNVPFSYNLDATSAAGIDSWSVNDTSNFEIDAFGVITNKTPLSIGSYGLNVSVTDIVGNQLSDAFTITVGEVTTTSTTTGTTTGTTTDTITGTTTTNGTPVIPEGDLGAIVAVIAVAAAVVIVIVILFKKGVIGGISSRQGS